MIHATSELGPKSSAASPLVKLCRMLRSTLRRFPRAHLFNVGRFGASLDEGTYIRVSYSGRLTVEDMRDCRVIRNLVGSRSNRLLAPGTALDGVLRTVELECAQSSTRQE